MKSKKKKVIIISVVIILILALVVGYFLLGDKKESKVNTKKEKVYSPYHISSNNLEDFDLYFMQLENEKKNKVYSPLSIKYALKMLGEGANGETKEQITDIIGDYSTKKYTNNSNMSFANALFVRDSYKSSIKEEYVNKLTNNYNAEVIYDSFKSADTLNSWVNNKTFKLINKVFDDVSDSDFILTNALAIDMDWNKKIQSEHDDYNVHYEHENYYKSVSPLDSSDYTALKFKDVSYKVKSAEIGASVNKYDIVSEVGEDKIRETVSKEYTKWLKEGACGDPESEPDVDTYMDTYMKEIKTGYKQISSSTDFLFYDDDNVKVFAKDLKEYSNTTLQYVGIMPKKDSLDTYIKNMKAENINTLINNLKPIELDSFKDGVITEITGYIPMFKFDYELALKDDLGKLGITDVFDKDKADLSNLSSSNAFIDKVAHKANIEFSNDGIKAGAVTALTGKGSAGCGFDYQYDVPVEKIDLTFDNPYMFIIRDKDTGEVWFSGTVYEPIKFQAQEN